MPTRDLLLLIGFLRSGQLFPVAVPLPEMEASRSLKVAQEAIEEQERTLFGAPPYPVDRDYLRRRSAVTSWSGAALPVGTRIGEVADPGVLLCLVYDGPAQGASLPVDVFAQTLRRYALRDAKLRGRFEEHVDAAGTFVPAWLSPEVRKQRSRETFDEAMKVARAEGFAHAAPLLEGVRGDCFAEAQVAIAIYELRDLGDKTSALRRLNEVVRFSPRNIAARMQRAKTLLKDAGRRVEAASDFLMVLREIARPERAGDASPELRRVAAEGLWELRREFQNPKKLEAALALSRQDPDRGIEALSRYMHTHPCAWDAHTHLAALALSRDRFDLAAKLLAQVRWLFPDDASPHFVYGQALAAKGLFPAAIRALQYALSLSPGDADIEGWLRFAHSRESSAGATDSLPVSMAEHVARSLLVLVALVHDGRLFPNAIALHKLPGDVSLALVLRAIASYERRRFSDVVEATEPEVDLRAVADRADLASFSGEALSADQTVGDVPDPGVVVAVLFPEGASRSALASASACRESLIKLAHEDSDLNAKLDRHLRTADATLKARLEM